MNVVVGWVILVVILSAISWAPPLFDMRWRGYARAWWDWNKLMIPLLAGVGLLTLLIMWALSLIGVIVW